MAAKVAKILNANYDSLTGLSNQQVFNRMVSRALETATSQGQFHCLLNIDLCKLLIVNDELGREAGDAAIRNVGRLIKSKLRNTDSIAYLGEGRYGVLLERCTLERGEEVAGNLRTVVEGNPLVWNGKTIDLNIAVGLALIEPNSGNVDEVLEAAEIARQSAKESGTSRIQTYRQNDLDLVDRKQRMQWVSRIQEALRENLFRMYCQAIDPVTTSRELYHFEVLLRLVDKQGEVIAPSQFIPPAEQFNLMPTIDRWVIDTTFRTMAESGFAQIAREGVVSINLSGQSLADGELPDYIFRKLVEHSIAPDCICFEITETVAFRDSAAAIRTMSAIKSLGCSLSLDDFGTGLSSFSYLKELPVDYLKIDGSFVRIILEDRIAHAMVASINQIGHVMGLKTVAEYVENDAIAERLALMGIDYLQGYYVCRTGPPGRISGRVENSNFRRYRLVIVVASMSARGEPMTEDILKTKIGVMTQLAPRASLTADAANELLLAAAQSSLQLGDAQLVVDLGSVQVLNSAALETLADIQDAAVRQGGWLKLVHANPIVRDILKLTGFDRYVVLMDAVAGDVAPPTDRPRRLGDILIKSGILSEEQVQVAVKLQGSTSMRMGQIILDKGWAQEADVLGALGEQLDVPVIRLRAGIYDPDVVSLLDRKTLTRLACLAVADTAR